MSPSGTWRLLSQAKVPLLMMALVVLLVVLALVANDRRQCREACLRAGHADYRYGWERFGEPTCDCVTREGRTVAAPQTGR